MPGIPRLVPPGVLPPFVGLNPTGAEAMSPFRATMLDVARRFATTEHRGRLLEGLLQLRAGLRQLGLLHGFQWLGGSFTEQKPGYEPRDIDVVTFFAYPLRDGEPATDQHLIEAGILEYMMPRSAELFRCDSYVVPLGSAGPALVSSTRYWFGLFGHTRERVWKGLVQVGLSDAAEDLQAAQWIAAMKAGEKGDEP